MYDKNLNSILAYFLSTSSLFELPKSNFYFRSWLLRKGSLGAPSAGVSIFVQNQKLNLFRFRANSVWFSVGIIGKQNVIGLF